MKALLRNIPPQRHLAAAAFAAVLLILVTGSRAAAQVETTPRPAANARQRQARGVNLMQRLGLTPEQRRQLRQIRRQSEAQARELTRNLRQARRALDEAIYADTVDEALVEQRTRQLAVVQNLLTHLRAATEMKIRGVLTAEQLKLFRTLRQEAQQQQMLQRRLNRGLPPSEAAPPNAPDVDAQPGTAPTSPPAARRRRP